MPRKTRIVFLDRGTVRADIGLPVLPFAHELVEHDRTSPDAVLARLQDAQVAIVNKVRLGEAESVLERDPFSGHLVAFRGRVDRRSGYICNVILKR